MKDKKIVIYGANGYTGKLFAQYLMNRGITPVLAGRSQKVEKLGQKLNCPTELFSIEKAQDHLLNADALVNCAGPFSKTQDPLIQACIHTQTHYLDVAGELWEVENAFHYDTQAKDAGIVVLSAAGFGVVPTEIAAKMACDEIEDPNHLTIAFATVGGVSRGTMYTVLKKINDKGYRLVDGIYEEVRPAQSEMKLDVFGKSFRAVNNPWRADLYAAQRSTGVENLETYSEFPGFAVSMMKGRMLWLRNLIINRLLPLFPEGPSEKQLKKGRSYIKAIAKNHKGQTSEVDLKGPEAYWFTVQCLYQMLVSIFENPDKRGSLTPSMLGTDWMMKAKDVEIKKSVR